MKLRTIAAATVLVLGTSLTAFAQRVTEQDIQEKLKGEGYTQVHDINFGAEAITARGVKDGKEWRLVLDSYGKVIQRQ
jgi:hypothetical protein